MPTRRTVLQMGALATLGVAGAELGPARADQRSGGPAGCPRTRRCPFAGVFLRPPELVPFETGFDDGDPAGRSPGSRSPHSWARRRSCRACRPRSPATTGSSRVRRSGPARGPGPRCGSATASRRPGSSSRRPSTSPPTCTARRRLPQYDGYANDITVPAFVKNYHYPNTQRARTLWYHDHRHLVTAQNVYSGLAAFYPLSDPFERAQLPQGEFDVPLMISDALFNADGSLRFDDNGTKGLWGDIILVNGVPWPTMKVKPRIYRFRVLDRLDLPVLPPHPVQRRPGLHRRHRRRHGARRAAGRLLAAGHRRARTRSSSTSASYKVGQTVDLRNLSNKNNIDFANTDKIMRFQVVEDSGPASTITAHPHHPGPRSAAGRARGAHRHDDPDPGDGRREAHAAGSSARTAVSGRSTGSPGRTWRRAGSPSCSPTRSRSASSSGRSSTSRADGSTRSTSTSSTPRSSPGTPTAASRSPGSWAPRTSSTPARTSRSPLLMQFDHPTQRRGPLHDPLPQPRRTRTTT